MVENGWPVDALAACLGGHVPNTAVRDTSAERNRLHEKHNAQKATM
jgi:hypothetical protein